MRDKRIFKLGTNQEILRLAGPDTVRIDAKGRTVIPGVINVHTHIHDGAMNKWVDDNPNTTAVKVFRVPGKNLVEIRRNLEVLMKERMGNIKPGQWSFFYLPNPAFGTGGREGYDFLRQADMKAEQIDEITGLEKPVLLAAHPAYIINTAAMNQLDNMYGGKTEDYPEGWTDVGFADLGVEYRREVVVDGYFGDKTDQLKEIFHSGLQENSAAGITTFYSHIMGIQNLDAYMRLFRENRLPIRFGFTHYTGFVMNRDAEGFYRRMGDLFQLGNEYMWFQAIGLGMIDHGPPLFCSTMIDLESLAEEGKKEDYYEWCRYSKETKNYKTIVTALSNGSRVVISRMRFPSMRIVVPVAGGRPVPSIRVPPSMTMTAVEGVGVCPPTDEKEEAANRKRERYRFPHIAYFYGIISENQGMGTASRIFSRIWSVDILAASA